MSHYFTNDQVVADTPISIHFRLNDRDFNLRSNAGVFSKDKLDTGTHILLETILKNESNPASVLDLGCGIGPVGVVLSNFWDTKVTMIDVNERAVELARQNMEAYHKEATVICQDGVQDGQYECIVLNPPIRTGKEVIYRLFDECIAHLSEGGRFWIVMRKQHGAQSAIKHFEEKGCEVDRVCRDKGYWILKVTV